MFTKFPELLKASIRNLRNFLETEVDLGITFAQIAEAQRRKGNAERYEVSKQNAITALEAIDRFKVRLPRDLKAQIEGRRAQLAELISTL